MTIPYKPLSPVDSDMPDKNTELSIRIKDPLELVAWIKENLPGQAVVRLSTFEIYKDDNEDITYQADMEVYDANHAVLIKTFWDTEKT